MRQICWIAALALAAPARRRLGALRLAIGGRRAAAAPKPRRYTLADLIEQPAILVGLRCWGGDRRSLERLLETFAPQEAGAMLPAGAADCGPVLF